jgi:hypothetical protein
MAHACRSASLSDKPAARQFIADPSGVNDLQRHGTPKVDIDCLVSYPHRPATEFERRSIFPREDLVML